MRKMKKARVYYHLWVIGKDWTKSPDMPLHRTFKAVLKKARVLAKDLDCDVFVQRYVRKKGRYYLWGEKLLSEIERTTK